MHADTRFIGLSQTFWANVRTISQELGYTNRATKGIAVHTAEAIVGAYERLHLSAEHLFDPVTSVPTEAGQRLLDYFEYRASTLTQVAEPNLMDAESARVEYEALLAVSDSSRKISRNKQKGEKAKPAMLTEMVNMVLESKLGNDFNYNPQHLTTVTRDLLPVRTLARRVDGAYPAVINPIAIWEIKEYYYTTTFGSRVADGVYETMLDGLELKELREEEGIDVKHYLIVDSHFTWWVKGRSYLCRMVDMLHMGLVNEVLFGREVLTRLPEIAEEWIDMRLRGVADDHEGESDVLEAPSKS